MASVSVGVAMLMGPMLRLDDAVVIGPWLAAAVVFVLAVSSFSLAWFFASFSASLVPWLAPFGVLRFGGFCFHFGT